MLRPYIAQRISFKTMICDWWLSVTQINNLAIFQPTHLRFSSSATYQFRSSNVFSENRVQATGPGDQALPPIQLKIYMKLPVRCDLRLDIRPPKCEYQRTEWKIVMNNKVLVASSSLLLFVWVYCLFVIAVGQFLNECLIRFKISMRSIRVRNAYRIQQWVMHVLLNNNNET